MYFINGCYWESDPTKTIFDKVIFHGFVQEKVDADHKHNGKIVTGDDVSSFVTNWEWDKKNKILKFIATLCADPMAHVSYHLTEIAPSLFEGTWEIQDGPSEKVRLLISPVSHQFFNRDTSFSVTA